MGWKGVTPLAIQAAIKNAGFRWASAKVVLTSNEPDVQQRLVELGVRPIGSDPDEFAEFLRKDRANWDVVIRAANIRLD